MGGAKVVVLKDARAELTEGTIGVWQVFLKPRDSNRGDRSDRKRPSSNQPTSGKPAYQPRRAKLRAATSRSVQAKAACEINERLSHVTLNDPIDL
jgi:hypothetical protein